MFPKLNLIRTKVIALMLLIHINVIFCIVHKLFGKTHCSVEKQEMRKRFLRLVSGKLTFRRAMTSGFYGAEHLCNFNAASSTVPAEMKSCPNVMTACCARRKVNASKSGLGFKR